MFLYEEIPDYPTLTAPENDINNNSNNKTRESGAAVENFEC